MAALVQSLTYAALALFFSILGNGGHIALRQLFIWPALLALIFFYCRSGRIVRRVRLTSPGLIVLFAVVFGLLALLIPPFHSTDLYDYVNYGWMQSHYHLNPYVNVVSDIPGWRRDRMLTATGWEHNSCAYGFLFALLTRILCDLGGGNLPLSLILFKITNLACLAAIGWLVFLCTQRLQLPSSLALCINPVESADFTPSYR